jgi:hypothetical protein
VKGRSVLRFPAIIVLGSLATFALWQMPSGPQGHPYDSGWTVIVMFAAVAYLLGFLFGHPLIVGATMACTCFALVCHEIIVKNLNPPLPPPFLFGIVAGPPAIVATICATAGLMCRAYCESKAQESKRGGSSTSESRLGRPDQPVPGH